ncbi:glutamate racemase [Shewanella algidipiscicola]|uniref:Glutamate racemase n=1 Tax=Shewanella algidipiscicola TaxID=614070 RepID=A0ABQ4PC47_9GAMM|nr:glutamate racemase [Shewanella algidipiscicola]GIU45140.1 glutamate racemase [Shewanella algidipiscicola]
MSANILVFDSGVGGLSILTEIKQTLPNENYYYLFDNARLPYGELEEDVLIDGAVQLITQAVGRVTADIVVVACNTASTLILPVLRARLAIPVVGVVPAIKPAATTSLNKRIGLLATPGTVNRTYTRTLIQKFAADCEVTCFGSSELVLLAEAKMAQEPIDHALLTQVLSPIKQSGIDTLVLGCTHFPILKAELQHYLGEGVRLLDSAKAIAARVKTLLNGDTTEGKRGESHAFFTTQEISKGLKTTLVEYGFSSIGQLRP